MKTVTLLVLITSLLSIALAPCLKDIYGISYSFICLPTSFDPSTIEVMFKHKTSEGLMLIAKVQHGSMAEKLDDRYTLGDNGRDLCIHDVTERDNGEYIAEATYADGRMVNETFCLTVHERVATRNHIPVKIASFITVAILVAALFGVKFCKRSKNSGQNEAENENLTSPVQDSSEVENENLTSAVQDSEESTFIDISHGKTDMKTKEEENNQGSTHEVEPSFDSQ